MKQTFSDFESAAHDVFASIPDEYREGVDGLRVVRKAAPHPDEPGVFTLGECVTERYPSEWEGPDTVRSVVVLYYGSFRKLAEADPDFDWEDQLWETLTHEIRHHLEWLASEDELEGVDYAMEQRFRRDRGQPFDPWYWQRGEEVDEGVFRVEDDVYLEREWSPEELEASDRIGFEWRGARYSIPLPEPPGDVHFVRLERLEDGPGTVELVLVRKRSVWQSVKSLLARSGAEVLESEADPRPG